jgi:hypothetical protein
LNQFNPMAKQNDNSTIMQKRKKTEKKLEEYKKTQLPLPFIFPKPEKQYSNTIELYDAIPKYFWGRISSKDRIGGRFLNILRREFEFRNKPFTVKITPARIEDKRGMERDYYPGKREELVEDVLRKMACDGKGLFLDDRAAVIFSLYQLQKELKTMGHTYSIKQIKDAILICQKSNLSLESDDGNTIVSFQLFETIGLRTRKDWKEKGNKTKCFVRFNTLVTRSIKNCTFRQLNYKECMTYKKNLARWLHKRMSHLYIQAAWNNSYSIMLTTIIRDSGMKRYEKLKDNLREVRKVFNEMIKKNVLSGIKEEKRFSGRKVIDVKFTIKPGYSFIRDMIRANKRLDDLKSSSKIYSSDLLKLGYPQKS